MYVCIYLCIYIYTYIYTYMHTFICIYRYVCLHVRSLMGFDAQGKVGVCPIWSVGEEFAMTVGTTTPNPTSHRSQDAGVWLHVRVASLHVIHGISQGFMGSLMRGLLGCSYRVLTIAHVRKRNPFRLPTRFSDRQHVTTLLFFSFSHDLPL